MSLKIEGNYKPIATFDNKREGIACMPMMARILGIRIYCQAPDGVMQADLPEGVTIEPGPIQGSQYRVLIARP